MSEIIMRRTVQGLSPVDQFNWEQLVGDRIKVGDDVKCKVTKSRNLKFHMKFFAMLRATFDMQDEFETMPQWRAVVTVGSGHCDLVPGTDGRPVAIPKSIAFHQMDETEFNRVYQDALTFICGRYVDDSPERLATILEFTS
jgi:hypothetical protein